MERLKKRADFLRLMRGRKWAAPGLVLQSLKQPDKTAGAARFGITVSRKVGGAVERNRAKRRLRELAKEILLQRALPAHDYVLIGRKATLTRSWLLLARDLETALGRVHGASSKSRSSSGGGSVKGSSLKSPPPTSPTHS